MSRKQQMLNKNYLFLTWSKKEGDSWRNSSDCLLLCMALLIKIEASKLSYFQMLPIYTDVYHNEINM
jgi:hypothetical protein